MSLDVSPRLLTEAENGAVKGEDFMETVRTSLPYAYALVARRSCAGAPVAVDAIRNRPGWHGGGTRHGPPSRRVTGRPARSADRHRAVRSPTGCGGFRPGRRSPGR
ncbi:hypothetical protein GR129_00855 [Streptomyces sp. HF10]|nr:hypothetical protein GR129_00855 [Streptomyces sp. HF10]